MSHSPEQITTNSIAIVGPETFADWLRTYNTRRARFIRIGSLVIACPFDSSVGSLERTDITHSNLLEWVNSPDLPAATHTRIEKAVRSDAHATFTPLMDVYRKPPVPTSPPLRDAGYLQYYIPEDNNPLGSGRDGILPILAVTEGSERFVGTVVKTNRIETIANLQTELADAVIVQGLSLVTPSDASYTNTFYANLNAPPLPDSRPEWQERRHPSQ